MNIYKSICIDFGKKEVITFVGAGGKTTAMFTLANELKRLGKKVLVTTTTAIFKPDRQAYDRLFIINHESLPIDAEDGTITVIGEEVSSEGKLIGISKESVNRIYEDGIFDYILVEGDGSKRKSIKAPADHEPVVPENTNRIVGIIGLDSLGKEVGEESIHRTNVFCHLTGATLGDVIDCDKISKLVMAENGLFKGAPINSRRYLILNKADDIFIKNEGIKIKKLITKEFFQIDGILVGSLRNEDKGSA